MKDAAQIQDRAVKELNEAAGRLDEEPEN
jgi:hypothetical protein